ncbi:MAG: hypothetical protein ABIG44_11990 [Planctomycetota bacterium]
MRTAGFIILATLWLLPAVCAQSVDAEQQKLLAERAAQADAYRKLAEAVYGLQINSRTYVQDFVTESDDIRADVDTIVKGVRLGAPHWYADGSCEVPAEVTVAKVVEALRTAHSQHYRGDNITTSDFEAMTTRINKNVIKVIGMGAPRPDLPPGLPAGVIELLGPAPGGHQPPIPEIWHRIGAQARLSAKRAAELDAYRHLAERIKGLRLTSQTTVRDFVMESDTIMTEMNEFLKGAQEKVCYYHHDELIAECVFVVPTEQVVSTVKKLHSRYYRGDDIKSVDIENVVRTVVKRDFEATGLGIPNPRFIRQHIQTGQLNMPEWSLRTLEIEGQGSDPAMDSPQGKLRAARVAEMNARRRLAEQIAGLPIQADTYVRDLVTQHEHIAVLVDSVVVDAFVVKTSFTTDAALVTIVLPGARVWDIVNDELQRQSH